MNIEDFMGPVDGPEDKTTRPDYTKWESHVADFVKDAVQLGTKAALLAGVVGLLKEGSETKAEVDANLLAILTLQNRFPEVCLPKDAAALARLDATTRKFNALVAEGKAKPIAEHPDTIKLRAIREKLEQLTSSELVTRRAELYAMTEECPKASIMGEPAAESGE